MFQFVNAYKYRREAQSPCKVQECTLHFVQIECSICFMLVFRSLTKFVYQVHVSWPFAVCLYVARPSAWLWTWYWFLFWIYLPAVLNKYVKLQSASDCGLSPTVWSALFKHSGTLVGYTGACVQPAQTSVFTFANKLDSHPPPSFSCDTTVTNQSRWRPTCFQQNTPNRLSALFCIHKLTDSVILYEYSIESCTWCTPVCLQLCEWSMQSLTEADLQ